MFLKVEEEAHKNTQEIL